jgi:hypothetical protein
MEPKPHVPRELQHMLLGHGRPAALLPQRISAQQGPLWQPTPQWVAVTPQYPFGPQHWLLGHSMPSPCMPHSCAWQQ